MSLSPQTIQTLSPEVIKKELGISDEELTDLLDFLASDRVMMNQVPVGIREFVTSPDYMDSAKFIYPAVLEELEGINGTPGEYHELLAVGGIGSAKTTVSLYTVAYHLYLLSCYVSPHEVFGLDPASEILIIFQSITETLAKNVDFHRFKEMLDRAPYFCRTHKGQDGSKFEFKYDRQILSELRFPNRIIVRPVSGSDTAAIGQNVISGMIDEVNYMAVVQRSNKGALGEAYDQASELYASIARRRESRFLSKRALPGVLCMVSSRRYPGQFTDRKEVEARKPGSGIYVFDKRVWDIKPEGTFNGEMFRVFAGDHGRKPAILTDEDRVDPDDPLIIEVPVEFRRSFEEDIYAALRDIAGVSSQVIHPYIPNLNSVRACFGRSMRVFRQDWTDLQDNPLDVLPGHFKSPKLPRYAHVDLALNGDSAGVAVGHVVDFRKVDRGDDEFEVLPVIHIDGVVEVRPPVAGEVIFSKIRSIFYTLRKLGMNVRWISYDSWQSQDSLQILRAKGFITGKLSMDVSTKPYDIAKQAFYDERVLMCDHDKTLKEFGQLMWDRLTNKIDHPPGGSKDCSDAVGGVIAGITLRREIWSRAGIRGQNIPPYLRHGLREEQDDGVGELEG